MTEERRIPEKLPWLITATQEKMKSTRRINSKMLNQMDQCVFCHRYLLQTALRWIGIWYMLRFWTSWRRVFYLYRSRVRPTSLSRSSRKPRDMKTSFPLVKQNLTSQKFPLFFLLNIKFVYVLLTQLCIKCLTR